MVVTAVEQLTADIRSYELAPATAAELPRFEPGAHISLQLPNGVTRSYSLIRGSRNSGHYTIAVKRDPASRGGSAYIHEHVVAGMRLEIGAPVNNFRLVEDVRYTVLVAGGIGITPIYTMARRLSELDRPWSLHYAARSPEHAAFLAQLAELPGKVHTYFAESGTPALRLGDVFDSTATDVHYYCCGPAPMIDAFLASAPVDAAYLHVERFAAQAGETNAGGCTVKLTRSGMTIDVPPGESILDAVLRHGVNVAYSCKEGLCGACETRVLDGVPAHRDLILDDDQKASGEVMMICCSGARSATLTLDL